MDGGYRGDKDERTQPDGDIGCCGYVLMVFSIIILILFFPFSLFCSLKVVQEYERAVIFRLGRVVSGGAKGPGLFFLFPCVDSFKCIDLRTFSYDIPPQEILTKDSVTVAVDAVIYARVFDAVLSVINIENAHASTKLLAATTLRNVLGTKQLSEILTDRETIATTMQILTKDSVTVAVDAVIYARIFDATMSVINVENAHGSTKLLAATTLRNVMGTKSLAEILSDREAISNTMQILTKDSVTVAVDAVIYARISDAVMSVINVENAHSSTKLLAATTLRNVMGTKSLAEILSDREYISHTMQTTLDEATDPWGVKVERVEVKDVRLPVQMQRAMAAEAESAREARAKVIAAEGEMKASRSLKEAADVISEAPAALQLRYLQTLNSIAAEKNSTIIFPIPVDMIGNALRK